ncbi:uridine kinase [Cellulomonas cellasea]|uniref:Uridine kinase n=2 Tax=Cellulomonas cellasea TaxID=43670 RepID=A0A0A0BC60_9CELL|nr:uridine kinase [Cellulomonas cellasea]KGM03444.1 uridine kinase [Cellulomonas cellasea DSM 20118]GEA88907.1 uridine kinase [Cellulomonas cellasea]
MRVEPVTPDALVAHVVGLLAGRDRSRHVRVLVDGPPPARAEVLADALVDPLRAAGRPVVRVRARDFLRAASVRLEHGREDELALYDDWVDLGALDREVLGPLGPHGSGEYLPSLRDPVRDRSTRARRELADAGTVLVLDGSLLAGRGLDVDVTVHLALRTATLERRTPPEERWTLPAYARHMSECDPEATADVVVRVDDPRHPALVHR